MKNCKTTHLTSSTQIEEVLITERRKISDR